MTSPLTHNISGTTKSYVQTVLGVIVYNEVKTLLWWASNFMVLIGAALYSQVRTAEMRKNIEKQDIKQNIEQQDQLQLDIYLSSDEKDAADDPV